MHQCTHSSGLGTASSSEYLLWLCSCAGSKNLIIVTQKVFHHLFTTNLMFSSTLFVFFSKHNYVIYRKIDSTIYLPHLCPMSSHHFIEVNIVLRRRTTLDSSESFIWHAKKDRFSRRTKYENV